MFKKSLCMMLFIISPYSHAVLLATDIISINSRITEFLIEYQEQQYADCLNAKKESIAPDEIGDCEAIAKEIHARKAKVKGVTPNDK